MLQGTPRQGQPAAQVPRSLVRPHGGKPHKLGGTVVVRRLGSRARPASHVARASRQEEGSGE